MPQDRLFTSLPALAAALALATPARAVEPTGKFERAPTTHWSTFTGSTTTQLTTLLGSTERIIDVHVDQVSPLKLTGATVSKTEAPYAIATSWDFDRTSAQVATMISSNSARLTSLKGYVKNGQTLYVPVTVSNTGANACAWSWFPDTTLPDFMTWLAASPDRVVDMSTWLDGAGVRHYAAVTLANTGTDQITVPSGAAQVLDGQTPAQIQAYLDAHNKARVIDLEPEGGGTYLVLLAYDGVRGNHVDTNGGAVAPDNWYIHALDQTGAGPLAEQYVGHVTKMTGARPVTFAPDGALWDGALVAVLPLPAPDAALWDGALVADQPLPTPDAQPTPNNDATNAFDPVDTRIETFMRQYGVTGAAIAIARGGKLVYARGYGYADTEQGSGTQATPSTLFRVGSISKFLTTVSVLKMIEQGKKTKLDNPLALGTPIFTEVLRPMFGHAGAASGKLASVTLGDALNHSAGYVDDAIQSTADPSASCVGNPLVNTACIAGVLGMTTTPSCQDLVSQWMMTTQPTHRPGSVAHYSNWAFCEAQTLVDGISGSAYQDYVMANIVAPLNPHGVDMFAPASDTYTPSATQAHDYGTTPAITVENQLVPQTPMLVDAPYGGVPMYPGLGAGAWKASPVALVKLATSINQSSPTGQLISASSFESMFTGSPGSLGSWVVQDADSGQWFGLGVQINSSNGDVYKPGQVDGGGGFLVFKNLIGSYDPTPRSCASCVVWVALINTLGGVDPTDGLNNSMINVLNQTGVTTAINAATVDMFPMYGLAAGG